MFLNKMNAFAKFGGGGGGEEESMRLSVLVSLCSLPETLVEINHKLDCEPKSEAHTSSRPSIQTKGNG